MEWTQQYSGDNREQNQKHENRSMLFTPSEQQKENILKENEHSLRDLRDNNTHIVIVPE